MRAMTTRSSIKVKAANERWFNRGTDGLIFIV
jgi:hypothetical protein